MFVACGGVKDNVCFRGFLFKKVHVVLIDVDESDVRVGRCYPGSFVFGSSMSILSLDGHG